MRILMLAAAVLGGVVLVLLLRVSQPSPPAATPRPVAPVSARALFPPEPATLRRVPVPRRAPVPPPASPERTVSVLGGAVPRYGSPSRRDFALSSDLAAFVLDRLGDAAAGDGEARYLVYLALDQCRTFMRMNAAGGWETDPGLGRPGADLTPEAAAAWDWEFRRCAGLDAGTWAAVGDALGARRPGAETEYASVWFIAAVESGYAPALAELALRPGPVDRPTRERMLREALASPDPDVYWLLFAHSGDVQTGAVGIASLAWLLMACEAGADCTEEARWYRAYVCDRADGDCQPGLSAVEHYWYAAPDWEREQAWALYRTLSESRDGAPLPALDGLDTTALQPRG